MTRTGARRTAVGLTGLLAGCVLLVGCGGSDGPPLYPVTGKVLVNGKPAENAIVVFHPVAGGERVKPRGQVKADGTYALTTTTTGDGAPAGEYRVTVEWWLSGMKKVSDPDRPPVNHLPGHFGKPETSGLTARVKDGPTEIETFELKSK